MQTKVIQFGNSKGIIIPAKLISDLKLDVGDQLEIKEKNERLILEKTYDELELDLAEIFQKYEKEHGKLKKLVEEEIDWGKVKGEEAW